MRRDHVKEGAEALAGLYVWDCVTSILEGSARPGNDRDVKKVLDISARAKQRLLKVYDAARAAQGGEQ